MRRDAAISWGDEPISTELVSLNSRVFSPLSIADFARESHVSTLLQNIMVEVTLGNVSTPFESCHEPASRLQPRFP